MKPFLLIGLSAALSLSSCTKDNHMETERRPGYGRDGLPHADEPPKKVRTNPNRRQHYQVIAKIKDAPLVFQKVQGSELYQAMNCRYTTSWFAGATANPQHEVLMHIIKVDDSTYVSDFYTDTPLNEDYYGQGVCEWKFLSSGFVMEATGTDKRETTLIADIRPEDLAKLTADNPEIQFKLFFAKKLYPIMEFILKENTTGASDSGIREEKFDLASYGINDKTGLRYTQDDFFTVELTIRRKF